MSSTTTAFIVTSGFHSAPLRPSSTAMTTATLSMATLMAWPIRRSCGPGRVSVLWQRAPACAGVIGFLGNEIAARIRLRGGRKLDSAALVPDGHHARVDGFVSLGAIVSALGVMVGIEIADPLVSLAVTARILRITWPARNMIRNDHG